MHIIGLTKKSEEKYNIELNHMPAIMPSDIYCWHAQLFVWKRKNCILFMNNQSRYIVFIYGIKKSDIKNLNSIFINQLKNNLENDGISAEKINRYLNTDFDVYYTKTTSRSLLGSINDIVYSIDYWIEDYFSNGVFQEDKFNMMINDSVMMPLKKKGYPPFPTRAMRIVLDSL